MMKSYFLFSKSNLQLGQSETRDEFSEVDETFDDSIEIGRNCQFDYLDDIPLKPPLKHSTPFSSIRSEGAKFLSQYLTYFNLTVQEK